MRDPHPTVRTLKPGDVWSEKDDIVQRENAARQWWAEAEEPERFAATMLVRYAMLRLLAKLDDWVPASVVAKEGDRLDVSFTVHLHDFDPARMSEVVDEEVLRLYAVKRMLELRNKLRSTDGDEG